MCPITKFKASSLEFDKDAIPQSVTQKALKYSITTEHYDDWHTHTHTPPYVCVKRLMLYNEVMCCFYSIYTIMRTAASKTVHRSLYNASFFILMLVMFVLAQPLLKDDIWGQTWSNGLRVGCVTQRLQVQSPCVRKDWGACEQGTRFGWGWTGLLYLSPLI